MASMLQARYTWQSPWASSVGTAIDFSGYGLETTFYVESGASSSGTITIESARTSAGPFVTIASTTISSTGSGAIMEVTGPFLFVRPRVGSSGGTWVIE